MTLNIVGKKCLYEDREKFKSLILDSLREVSERGIGYDLCISAVNYLEFLLRDCSRSNIFSSKNSISKSLPHRHSFQESLNMLSPEKAGRLMHESLSYQYWHSFLQRTYNSNYYLSRMAVNESL